MPVKNTAKYLAACVDSIIAQSYQRWELIVVDDHSTDGSKDMLSDYALRDERINILENEGSGIIEALRLAYKHTSGAYITRMDSDDVMHIDKLKLLHHALIEEKDTSLAVGLVEYFSDGQLGEGYRKYASWLNDLTQKSGNFSDIYKECPIPSPCWMCSREVLNEAGAFHFDVYPEDYDLAFRFKSEQLKIKPVNQIIHYWRDYQNRTSRTDEHYSDNRFSALKVYHFIKQDYKSEEPLILWGAGHKGKALAKLLIKAEVTFSWICNNPNKIGKDIYGKILLSMNVLNEMTQGQVIVSISTGHEDDAIVMMIRQNAKLKFYRFS